MVNPATSVVGEVTKSLKRPFQSPKSLPEWYKRATSASAGWSDARIHGAYVTAHTLVVGVSYLLSEPPLARVGKESETITISMQRRGRGEEHEHRWQQACRRCPRVGSRGSSAHDWHGRPWQEELGGRGLALDDALVVEAEPQVEDAVTAPETVVEVSEPEAVSEPTTDASANINGTNGPRLPRPRTSSRPRSRRR